MKCDMCGKEITKGSGKIYIQDDSKVFNFCSGKCEAYKLKRGKRGRFVKWTTTSRALRSEK